MTAKKRASAPHRTRPVRVWADVDVGIAECVEHLNEIPGVRTHASCQGTIGEGGAEPYPAEVMVSWKTPEAFARLKAEFDIPDNDQAWCYVYPCMEKRTRFEPGWLGRQFEKAESDVKQWPEWKRRLGESK